MDSKSMHKLLYSLQIVEGIMMNCKETKAAQPAKESWIEQFCKKEGLAHLFSALLNLPIVSINNPLTRKCFALLLKVLFIIQASGYPFGKYIRDYETRRERLVERVLLILDSFAKHSILSQAERSLRTPKKAKTAIENPATVTAVPQATGQPELTQKEKKRQAEEANAFSQGFALIRGEKAEAYNYFEQLMKFAGFKPFLLKALVLSDNQKLQQALSEELVGIYKLFMGKEYSPSHAHVVLMPFMLKDMVNETLERETKCQCFYQLVCRMVKETPTEDLQRLPVNFHDQICDLSSRIKERPVKENKSTDTDEVMIGLMNLVEALLKRFPSEKEFVGSTQGLLYEVLHHCLFDFPKSGSRQRSLLSLPPKCKSQGARQAAFSLLSTLASDTPKNLKQVIDYLAPIHVYPAPQ